MSPVRLFAVAIAVGMVALLGYGMATAPGLQPILDSMVPFWGKFVWIDVYAGFALFAVIVFAFERRAAVAGVVVLATLALGNIVTAAWLAWRAPELLHRIKDQNA